MTETQLPPDDAVSAPLRAAAGLALLAGAAASLAFLFHASHNRQPVLLAMFVVWVLSPFAVLALAHFAAAVWTASSQTGLYKGTVSVALGTLLVYGYDAWRPRKAQPAFVFVVVPLVSWVVIAIVFPMVARRSARRSDRRN